MGRGATGDDATQGAVGTGKCESGPMRREPSTGDLRTSPGPLSAGTIAAWTDRTDPSDHGDRPGSASRTLPGPVADVIDAVMAGRRLEGWALWCQLTALARLIRQWSEHPLDADDQRVDDDDAEDDRMDERARATEPVHARLERRLAAAQARARLHVPTAADLTDDFVAAEISAACGLTRHAADARVLAARILLLERTLPRSAALLRTGLLDWPKIQILTSRLGIGLEPLLAAAVETVLIPDDDLKILQVADGRLDVWAAPASPGAPLPAVTRMTVPALTALIESIITDLDGRAAAERGKAAREQRRVATFPGPDGTARLEAAAGAEHIAAMWHALTEAAHAAKKAGDRRTVDQLRLDELLARVTGARRRATGTGPGSGDGQGPADQPTTLPGRDDTHDTAAGQGRGTVTAGSAFGLCSCGEPCVHPTDAHGGVAGTPIGPRTAVSLTMPLATYLALADEPSILEGHPIAAALARQIAADAARDHASTTTWRCVIVDDEHGTVLGVGRPVSTPRHDPPPRLVDLIRSHSPWCVFPGCRTPARRCDLDHRIAYDHDDPAAGGPTCDCNVQPLCRTHHRLKTTGLITVRAVPAGTGVPGELEWITRAGVRHRVRPDSATPRSAPRHVTELAALLRDRQRRDTTLLAWTNAVIAGAYVRGRRAGRMQLLGELAAESDAERRHHAYGDINASSDPFDHAADVPPEPEDAAPVEPGWLRGLRRRREPFSTGEG